MQPTPEQRRVPPFLSLVRLVAFAVFLILLHPIDTISQATEAEVGRERAANHHFELGEKYRTGEGKPKSYDDAKLHYERAALLGHSNAQFRLATMLIDGLGGARNIAKALEWGQRSADKANIFSLILLGDIYCMDDIKTQDMSRAHAFYSLARYVAEQDEEVRSLSQRKQISMFSLIDKRIEDCLLYRSSGFIERSLKIQNDWKSTPLCIRKGTCLPLVFRAPEGQ